MVAAKDNKYCQKYTEEDIQELCEDIQKFAESEKAAHFATWARQKKKTKSWINEMARDYPEFDKAYKNAKALMSAKLVNRSIYGNDPTFNATNAMKYQGVYNEDWREYKRFLAEIQKENVLKEENKCKFNEWKEKQKIEE